MSVDDPNVTDDENGLVLDDDESQQLQEVFSTIFPQYLIPLEELVGQIIDGKSSPEIIEGLRGAVGPLASAAESIGVRALKDVLYEFKERVENAGDGTSLTEAHKDGIIDVFYRLREAVHNIGGDTSGSEGARSDFVARISDIDGIGPNEVQRILAAGLATAEQIVEARADEIAAVTGLSMELAERIQHAFGKKTGGGGRRRSGGGTSSPVRRAPRSKVSKLSGPELQARLGLIAAMRERLRLTDRIAVEGRELEQLRAAEEVARRVALTGEQRLKEKQREVEEEKRELRSHQEEIDRLRADIVELREELPKAAKTSGAQELAELRERLGKLKKRVGAQSRWR